MAVDSNLVISIVAPIRNMAGTIEPFLEDILRVLEANYSFFEVILVDDGSTDSTPAVVHRALEKYRCMRYLKLSRHFGSEIAISAGLDSVIGDFTVVISPETDPCEMIPELIKKVRQSGDILTGVIREGRLRGLPAKMAATAFLYYCRRHLGIEFKKNSTNFRVLSRQVVNAITQIKDRRRHLRLFTNAVGYDLQYFEYTPINRTGRNDSRGFFEEVNEAIDIIVAGSSHPLRFASRLGLLAGVLDLGYIGYVSAIYFWKTRVAEGWTTTSLTFSVMFFFLFLILAILCEYVGRLLEETQGRPIYFIMQEKNSSVLLEHQFKKNVVNVSTDLI